MEVYLDNAATTQVDPAVIDVMVDMMASVYGNPSSLHRLGMQAEKRVKEARRQVAKALGATPEEFIFTSGGTEASNLAIQGILEANEKVGKHIVSTEIEHPATLTTLEAMVDRGWTLTLIKPDETGAIRLEDIQAAIQDDTILVSMMHVNNETGTIQPVEALGKWLLKQKRKCFFHVDGIQAVGKIPVKLKRLGADLYSISAHKFHGPKGVGALYVKKGTRLQPRVYGGGQESSVRPGTENVPGLVGMGLAVEKATRALQDRMNHMEAIKQRMYRTIVAELPNSRLNGTMEDGKGASHILNITFAGMRGEVLLHTLEGAGISVSTGSACASKNKSYSHVLTAMGKTEAQMEGAIRFSFNGDLTEEQIDYAIATIVESVRALDAIIQGR